MTTINEASAKLTAALAAYKETHTAPLRPEADTLIPQLSNVSDHATIFAFAKIVDLWPAKPARRPLPPEGYEEIIGNLDEFIPPPYWTLIDALVAGLIARATVAPKVGAAKKTLAAMVAARPHWDELEWLLRKAPDEVRDALRQVKNYLDTREDAARDVLDVVSREGRKPGTGKAALDWSTREGLRQAIFRIRTMAPKASYPDIEPVLAAAFDVPVELVNAKALTERRPKPAKVRAREKAKREAAKASAAKKKAPRKKPRP
jgi:hypothetical protein